MSFSLKTFSFTYTMFEVSFRFLMLKVQLTFVKILPLYSSFQDLFNDIIYFSAIRIFVDFVLHTCDRGEV